MSEWVRERERTSTLQIRPLVIDVICVALALAVSFSGRRFAASVQNGRRGCGV